MEQASLEQCAFWAFAEVFLGQTTLKQSVSFLTLHESLMSAWFAGKGHVVHLGSLVEKGVWHQKEMVVFLVVVLECLEHRRMNLSVPFLCLGVVCVGALVEEGVSGKGHSIMHVSHYIYRFKCLLRK